MHMQKEPTQKSRLVIFLLQCTFIKTQNVTEAFVTRSRVQLFRRVATGDRTFVHRRRQSCLHNNLLSCFIPMDQIIITFDYALDMVWFTPRISIIDSLIQFYILIFNVESILDNFVSKIRPS